MRKLSKWFKVVITPTYDDIPNDDDTQTFYMLTTTAETAKANAVEAVLAAAYDVGDGPHGVHVDYVRTVKSPPAGLYQKVSAIL